MTAVLTGARARYGFETHELRAGATCRVAVLGGMRGEARVEQATPERIALALSLSLAPLTRRPIDLIVGVPRPQTVKKVIQAAVMVGVRSLHFVRSELGEKSYLQSRALSEDGIREEGLKALEQVWDSQMPDVGVHRTLSHFLKTRIPLLGVSERATGLVADPRGDEASLSYFGSLRAEQVLAIGPERGWSEAEVELFRGCGFDVVGLGERVLRVEMALVVLLGQLQLVR